MIDKKQARLRRARKTRAKIAELKTVRLSVHRSNCHIYAQVISGCGSRVIAAASTVETDVRSQVANGGNKAGVEQVSFDRSGFLYHGRVKALAEAAREGGLKF